MNMYFMRADKMLELIQRAEAGGCNRFGQLIEHYMPEYQINTYEYTGYMANIDSIPAYSMNMNAGKEQILIFVPRKPKRHH